MQTLAELKNAVGDREATAQPKPDPPQNADAKIRAYLEKCEQDRLRRRKEVRQEIAQREVVGRKLADIEEQLRMLDARADRAAAEHSEEAAAIQSQLAAAAGAKKSDLLAKLVDLNLKLQQMVDAINHVRNPLLTQHRETRSEYARLPTSQRLSGADLCDPQLAAELHAAKQRIAAAESRVKEAAGQLAYAEEVLELARTTGRTKQVFGWYAEDSKPVIDLEAVRSLTDRVRRWKFEATAAAEELHAAQAAAQEVHQAMIAE